MGENANNHAQPFRVGDRGLTSRQARKYRRLLRGVYVDASTDPTALVMAKAAGVHSRGLGVLGGRSAAAALGTRYLDQRRRRHPDDRRPTPQRSRYREHDRTRFEYFDPEPPVLIRPRSASMRSPRGLVTAGLDLPGDEVVLARGMRVTSPARTAFDIGRWPASALPGWAPDSDRDFERRLILLDALCNATKLTVPEIRAVADRHPRAGGLSRLRELLPHVDGKAESPPETRLRLLITGHGLPRPDAQVPVSNEYGVQIAHVDLGWPQWCVGAEYDGDWHWEDEVQRPIDIARYADYESAGWDVLRVEKSLLNKTPAVIIGELEARLRRAGANV